MHFFFHQGVREDRTLASGKYFITDLFSININQIDNFDR